MSREVVECIGFSTVSQVRIKLAMNSDKSPGTSSKAV
jgi:hypothetical protein